MALMAFSAEESDLLYVTNLGHISLISIRLGTTKWTASQPIVLGRPTACYLDSKQLWLLIGTSSGSLALWDLRYGLMVRHWQISQTGIEVIAPHPARGKGKWVVVASQVTPSDRSEIETATIMVSVDLSNGEVVERFQTTSSTSSTAPAGFENEKGYQAYLNSDPTLDSPARAVEAILAGKRDTESIKMLKTADVQNSAASTVRAIHAVEISPGDTSFSNNTDLSPVHESFDVSHGQERHTQLPGGFILTVSRDRIVRLWNLGHPAQSLVVSGAGRDANKRYRCGRLAVANSTLSPN